MTGSWKSTLAGAVTALFAFVLFSPKTFGGFPWLIQLSKFAVVGRLAGLGLVSKDYDVAGDPRKYTFPFPNRGHASRRSHAEAPAPRSEEHTSELQSLR